MKSSTDHNRPVSVPNEEFQHDLPDQPLSYSFDHVRDWVSKHCSSGKLGALLDEEVVAEMDGEDWLVLLGEYWSACDNIGFRSGDIMGAIMDKGCDVESTIPELMSAEEKAAFEALPEEITIYRGCRPINKYGFSWSLSREIAVTFPFKRGHSTGEPTLLTATISKNRAAALKLDRREHEIVVFDYADEPSVHWTEEALLTDPAGNPIQSSVSVESGN